MSDENIVEVYRARDPMQAHLFSSELQNDGIENQVVGDHLGGALGEVPLGWSTAPKILVKEGDAVRARELLMGYEKRVGEHDDELEAEFEQEENEEGTEI